MAAIQAKGKLVVTTEAGYAPFEFLDENDNVIGLDASLAQKLADDLGVELDMQNIAFDSVVAEVQAGNADMAIAGLTPNNDRKNSVDLSDMYYEGEMCIRDSRSTGTARSADSPRCPTRPSKGPSACSGASPGRGRSGLRG